MPQDYQKNNFKAGQYILTLGILGGLIIIISIIFRSPTITTEPSPLSAYPRTSSLISPLGSEADNLTSKLNNRLVQTIITANDFEFSSDGVLKVPNQNELDSLISETISDFDPASIKPVISDSDIIISSSSGPASYFQEFQNILLRHPLPNQESFDSNATIANAIQSTISVYDSIIDDFYSLPVPADLKHFHKTEISLLSARRDIALKSLNFNDDPLMSLLYLQSEEYLDQEFAKLTRDINQYLIDNNITFD